jgi:Ras-related protein Rab-28
MINNYIYGAHAVLLCYDITNNESFQDLEDWFRLVKKSFGKEKLPLVVLCGNKTDLEHMRAVKEPVARRFATENDMLEFNVSAKSGDRVNATFYSIAANLTGTLLPKNELDSVKEVISAQITTYVQHDDEVEGGQVPEYTSKKGACSVS